LTSAFSAGKPTIQNTIKDIGSSSASVAYLKKDSDGDGYMDFVDKYPFDSCRHENCCEKIVTINVCNEEESPEANVQEMIDQSAALACQQAELLCQISKRTQELVRNTKG
jgi:hypothetical protein